MSKLKRLDAEVEFQDINYKNEQDKIIKTDLYVPFEFCKNCDRCNVETQTVIEGDYKYIYPTCFRRVHTCKHRDICRNAVKLFKEVEDE